MVIWPRSASLEVLVSASTSTGSLPVVKLSFNLPQPELDSLKSLAEARGITMTHALRQAIATEVLLDSEISDGSKVIIESRDGVRREVIFRG